MKDGNSISAIYQKKSLTAYKHKIDSIKEFGEGKLNSRNKNQNFSSMTNAVSKNARSVKSSKYSSNS